MPPKAVKTIRDLIYWQYAKIISESAGFGKKQFAFVFPFNSPYSRRRIRMANVIMGMLHATCYAGCGDTAPIASKRGFNPSKVDVYDGEDVS